MDDFTMSKRMWAWTSWWPSAVATLFAGLIMTLAGIKRFEAWPQVEDLWLTGVSPLFLGIAGHPHFFRYLTAYPGFVLEQGYPLVGFSVYISLFMVANVALFRTLALSVSGRTPHVLMWAAFFTVHLFMNGRGVIAWTGWLLAMTACWQLASGQHRWRRVLLLTALSSWLAAVSTGVFVVAVAAMALFYFQSRSKQRMSVWRRTLLCLGALPLFYVVGIYFIVAVNKNLDFYGGGLAGAVQMLAHGMGTILLGSEYIALLLVAGVAFFSLFTYILMRMRARPTSALEKLIACAMVGGLFGFTVLTLVIPALLLYAAQRTNPTAQIRRPPFPVQGGLVD